LRGWLCPSQLPGAVPQPQALQSSTAGCLTVSGLVAPHCRPQRTAASCSSRRAHCSLCAGPYQNWRQQGQVDKYATVIVDKNGILFDIWRLEGQTLSIPIGLRFFTTANDCAHSGYTATTSAAGSQHYLELIYRRPSVESARDPSMASAVPDCLEALLSLFTARQEMPRG